MQNYSFFRIYARAKAEINGLKWTYKKRNIFILNTLHNFTVYEKVDKKCKVQFAKMRFL